MANHMFWNSWQLWEKMCFVLGAAICVVLAGGCGKVLYSRWRLRKYTALLVAKEAHRQEMQRVGSSRRHKGPDVPFGIRAIESGIEVDGVWISRSNTPAQSIPATPAPASPASGPSIAPRPQPPMQEDSPDRSSSASNISRLDIPQPVYGYPTANLRQSGPSSVTLNSTFDRLKPGANSPIPPGPDLPDLARVQQIRPTYRPRHSSQLRYSNSHNYDNNAVATTAAPEDGRLSPDLKGSDASDDSKVQHVQGASAGSADSSPPSFERDELDSASEFSFRMTSPDTFNGRKPVSDGPSFRNKGYQSLESEQIPPAVPRIKLIGVNSEPYTSRRTEGQNIHFSKPRTPLYEGDDPFTTSTKSPEEMQETRLLKGVENSDPLHPQYKRGDNNESARGDFDSRTEFNRQQSESQVIRKINSGFEILRPGTLDRPQAHDDTKLKGENNSERHLSRKLQRKSRDVSQPRESRFVEET